MPTRPPPRTFLKLAVVSDSVSVLRGLHDWFQRQGLHPRVAGKGLRREGQPTLC